MSYEKTTWADGDVITAEKLNNIEDGIGDFVFVTNEQADSSLDKTFAEIEEAFNSGKLCFACVEDSTNNRSYKYPIVGIHNDTDNNYYQVFAVVKSDNSINVEIRSYSINSKDSYPAWDV